MTRERIQRVSGQGSAYTVLARRIDPDEHGDALESVGYTSPFTQFVVWTSGGQCWTDHDEYRLVRKIDGSNDWLLTELKRIEDELVYTDA